MQINHFVVYDLLLPKKPLDSRSSTRRQVSYTTDRAWSIKAAVFDRITTNGTPCVIVQRHHLILGLVNKYNEAWMRVFFESQPQNPPDINITVRQVGRPVVNPCSILKAVKCVRYYVETCVPLKKTGRT